MQKWLGFWEIKHEKMNKICSGRRNTQSMGRKDIIEQTKVLLESIMICGALTNKTRNSIFESSSSLSLRLELSRFFFYACH